MGVTNARSFAKLAALVANRGEFEGVRLFKPSTIDKLEDGEVPRKVYPGYTQEITHFTKGGICIMK